MFKQECIPVGCVPSAAVAICWGGGCLPGGVSAQRGCLPRGGVCPGVCLPGGVSAQGAGVSAGVCLADTPPVDRMTDPCENITLP